MFELLVSYVAIYCQLMKLQLRRMYVLRGPRVMLIILKDEYIYKFIDKMKSRFLKKKAV